MSKKGAKNHFDYAYLKEETLLIQKNSQILKIKRNYLNNKTCDHLLLFSAINIQLYVIVKINIKFLLKILLLYKNMCYI